MTVQIYDPNDLTKACCNDNDSVITCKQAATLVIENLYQRTCMVHDFTSRYIFADPTRLSPYHLNDSLSRV